MTLNGDYVTMNEAAQILGIDKVMVLRYVQSLRLNAVKVNPKCWLLLRNDVQAFKRQRELHN
jgi:excisionase family DNA binding protein